MHIELLENSYLVTILSSWDCGTEPLLTASTKLGPKKEPPFGMAMSKPARAEATPECCPPQSETTKPWNPSSVFNIPFKVLLFAHAYELLTLLYEHMMQPEPAWTASWNGHR